MSRLSSAQLVALAMSMPDRERGIIETIGRLRLVSGGQLERLFFVASSQPQTRAGLRRRVLGRLLARGVLFQLARPIGGVRAGSAGAVYGLGSAGKRLVAYWQGEGLRRVRTPHEPEVAFVRHTLAIGEHYVRLVEAQRTDQLELLEFLGEPDCWRRFVGPGGRIVVLKPDAFVRLGVGDFEERSFLEVDLGTVGRGALRRKCSSYIDYYRCGREQAETGVFPRVAWITTNQARVSLLVDVCASLPSEYWPLFCVGTPERAVASLSGTIATTAFDRRGTS